MISNPSISNMLNSIQEMVETIENYNLYVEAEKRMKNTNGNDFISNDDVLLNLGITKDELK